MKKQRVEDDRLELLFRHAGLAEKQAKLYRLLLSTGEERVSALSRKSGIKRGNTYALLRDLKTRGLVTEFEKGKITYFRPEPPEKLVSIIEAREKEVAIAKTLASDMIPTLAGQYRMAVNRPTVTYLEGEEGLRRVFEDIYTPDKKEIHGALDIEASNEVFPEFITKELIPQRVRYKIKGWALLGKSLITEELAKNDEKQLRTTILFDKENYPLPAEIEVYEDKIAMMSFAKGEFIGLIIQNHDFATSLQSIFRFIFDENQKHPKTTPPAQAPELS